MTGQHIGTVAIRPVTPQLRLATVGALPMLAEFAVVIQTAYGSQVLVTDGDRDGMNITAAAEALAFELGARYVAPESVCEYCAKPTVDGRRYCYVVRDEQIVRDCAAAYGRSEVRAWAARPLLVDNPTGARVLAGAA